MECLTMSEVPMSPNSMPASPAYSMYPTMQPPSVQRWTRADVTEWLKSALAHLSQQQVDYVCRTLGDFDGLEILAMTLQALQERLRNPDLGLTIFAELSKLMQNSHSYARPLIAEDVSLIDAINLFDSSPQPIFHDLTPADHPRPAASPVELPACGPPTSPVKSRSFTEQPPAPAARAAPETPQQVSAKLCQRRRAGARAGARAGGRPRRQSQPQVVPRTTQTKQRSNRSGSPPLKGRLWEFFVRLLRDSEHNPAIIRWEDENRGVFAFVDGRKVAELWGQQKLNKSMNYEKMSRTMRTYKNKAFAPHPRRLFYQFGEKAQWSEPTVPSPRATTKMH